MQFEVQILGSNSAIAEHGRHPTAQVVYIHDRSFLIDCGEGTQLRMRHFGVRRFKIECIFISHLHGDHYFGLIGLLTTYHLLHRTTPLTIYGPPKLLDVFNLQLSIAGTTLCYPLHFVALDASNRQLLMDDHDLRVYSFPVKHRIPTVGFLFEEKCFSRKIDKEAVKDLGLEPAHYQALREGKDITLPDSRYFRNDTLTLPSSLPRSYAYCADTLFDPELATYFRDANLMYHEATFMHDHSQRAFETFHSTSRQAAEMAEIAGVQQLLIGHFSSKYLELSPLLQEAREVFTNTFLAEEGLVFEVPATLQK